VYLGLLVNVFNDLIDEGGEYARTMTDGQRYTQASLALGALFVTRCIGHNAMVMGTDIRDRCPQIMLHMWVCWSQIASCSALEKLQYGEAHLWVLYLGALYEKRREMEGKKSNSTGGRFQRALSQEAAASSVTTWNQMDSIARKFAQTELLRPEGHHWFEDTLKRFPATKAKRSTTTLWAGGL
jgi:hypothetical protein